MRRDDNGSISIEAVMLWPAVFLLIFGMVQGGIWFHARGLALAAAQEGAHTASINDGAGGADRARAFLARTAPSNILKVHRIAEAADHESVTITVTGSSTMLVPGWTVDVSQSSTAPIRRWTSP